MFTTAMTLLRPPEPPLSNDPKEQQEYLRRVSRYHFIVSTCVLALLVGGAWAMSPVGFARAGTVDSQIEKALRPIQAKQTDTDKVINRIESVQTRDSLRLSRSLANGISSEIRFIQSKRCKEKSGEERERLWREIEKKQEEYKELRGESYPLPTCNEL